LDGGTGEDDPVDPLGLQGVHRLGHREVGLAGAGRADAEGDRVGLDRVDVRLLAQRLGPDGAAARGEDVEGQDVGGPLGGRCGEHADGTTDGVGGECLTAPGDLRQLVDEALGEGDVTGRAGEGHDVAADVDVDVGET